MRTNPTRCPASHVEPGLETLVVERDGHLGSQFQRFRSGPGRDHPLALHLDPRSGPAVVEPRRQYRRHRDRSAQPLHHPNHPRMGLSRRHAIDDADRSLRRLDVGLEHEGRGPVASRRLDDVDARSDPPRAVLLRAEEAGEAGRGIEAGQAEPIDRAVQPHQCSRMGVADQRVVLDAERHRPSRSPGALGACSVPRGEVTVTELAQPDAERPSTSGDAGIRTRERAQHPLTA